MEEFKKGDFVVGLPSASRIYTQTIQDSLSMVVGNRKKGFVPEFEEKSLNFEFEEGNGVLIKTIMKDRNTHLSKYFDSFYYGEDVFKVNPTHFIELNEYLKRENKTFSEIYDLSAIPKTQLMKIEYYLFLKNGEVSLTAPTIPF